MRATHTSSSKRQIPASPAIFTGSIASNPGKLVFTDFDFRPKNNGQRGQWLPTQRIVSGALMNLVNFSYTIPGMDTTQLWKPT
jgi:hypothetical protein